MLDFTFCSPTKFVFGKDSQLQVAALLREFGATRVLIHYGGGSVVRSGLLDQVRGLIADAGLFSVSLGGAQPNPRSGLVYEGIDLAKRERVDFVLAVGGGSAIDSAKAIAAGACYDGDFWDFYGPKVPMEACLPIGVVLTIPATGSEGSTSSVITQEKGMLKRGRHSEFHRPRFSILNPELTYTLPPFQTACGIADMMAHIIERYFTNTPDVDLTDRMCEAVLQSVLLAGPKAMAKADDYEARATLMWAGMLAHNNLLGVGREQDWSSHAIGHELSALYDVAHGASLTTVIPAWMTFQLDHSPMRFAQFATRVMDCQMNFERPEETGREGIAHLTAFWRSLGLPTTLSELGAKGEDIPRLAAKVSYNDQGTVGFFRPLREADVRAILELANR